MKKSHTIPGNARKVLHILGALNPSGWEVNISCTAALWRAQGYESEILAVGATEGPYAGTLRQSGYLVHHLPFAKNLWYFCSLIRLLRARRIDVVHIHCERGVQLHVLAARLAGAQGIVKTHHNVFRYQGLLRWRRTMERWLCRQLGCVFVSISPSVTRNEQQRFHSPSIYCPHWYDDKIHRPRTRDDYRKAREQLSIASAAFCIVTVGNCSAQKNHELLIAALAKIGGAFDWVYYHLGMERTPEPERVLCRQVQADERVHFMGVRPPALYLQAADAYVMCSRTEGFSAALLEAMATGCPTCLTRVPGLMDWEPLVPDILFASEDATELAACLRSLAQLPMETRWQKGARLCVVAQDYTPTAGVRRYTALYDNLLS